MVGQQVFLRLRDGKKLAADSVTRRAVATAVLGRRPELGLLAFRVVGGVIRLVTNSRAGAELGRRIEVALARRVGRFEPARIEPINGQWHLDRAVRQLLRRAGSAPDDSLAEGSNLPDLLAIRAIGEHTAHAIRRALPRIHRGDLLECLGLARLEPADGPLELLADAAAATLGLPGLAGKGRAHLAASGAAIEVAASVGMTSSQIARLLGLHRATVARRRREPCSPRLVRAVGLQLGLRRARVSHHLAGT